MTLERNGVPTATFVTHVFDDYARGLCRMQGMETLPIVVLPHPIAARPVVELKQKVADAKSALYSALGTAGGNSHG